MKETSRRTKNSALENYLSLGGRKWNYARPARSHAVRRAGGVFEFLQQVGYCEAVRQHLPFRLTSPNAIDPVETFTAFLLAVGGRGAAVRTHQFAACRCSPTRAAGITRFPVDDTIRNLFQRFGQGQCQRFFSRLVELATGAAAGMFFLDIVGFGLDVLERYGRPQGALRGPTREAMDGPRINRWWRCWPKRIF